MGMFDYVHYKCPKCKELVEEQSKASDCTLAHYFIGDGSIAYELPILEDEWEENIEYLPAPLEIIAEASRYGLECKHCGYKTKPVISSSYVLVPFEG